LGPQGSSGPAAPLRQGLCQGGGSLLLNESLHPPVFAAGHPPPTRLFAKSVRERADRKWMWLVPPCGASNRTDLTVTLPPASADGGGPRRRRLRALSYFAMVSPGAKLRHTIDGQPARFDLARGSFLAQSWGYLQRWHMLPGAEVEGEAAEREREWRLCAEVVPNAKCVGWRCGLEFKMPMKTAAVGWFLTLAT